MVAADDEEDDVLHLTFSSPGNSPRGETRGGNGGLTVQEPEAEEEADGWEIVTPPQTKPRGDSNEAACLDGSLLSTAVAVGASGEFVEDFVMGCLDPHCQAQFDDNGCERCICACCRLLFCGQHVTQWMITAGRPRILSLCSDMGGAGALSCSGSSTGNQWSPRGAPNAASMLVESLGLPSSAGVATVCRECRAALGGRQQDEGICAALGMVPSTRRRPAAEESSKLANEPPEDSHPSAASTAPDMARAPTRRLASPGTDAAAVAAEAQAMWAVPVDSLRREEPEEEDDSRAAARQLLLRHLARLRVCLRPWAEHERDWLWRWREELTEAEPGWVAQFARHACWESTEHAKGVANLVERAHSKQQLDSREAVQVLSILGRHAGAAVAAVGERRLGLIAARAAEAAATLHCRELACCLEVLLDAGEAFGSVGATGGRRAVVGLLLKAARLDIGAPGSGNVDTSQMGAAPLTRGQQLAAATLRGELFWALEARSASAAASGAFTTPALSGSPGKEAASGTGTAGASTPGAWASVAVEELLRGLSPEVELALLRQKSWVRSIERGEVDSVRVEPGWGEPRAFPIAVWHPERRCLGLESRPREASSKSAPLYLRCRCHFELTGSIHPALGARAAGETTAGLLLKRDSAMRHEQQVGQTLRLLERFVWEDEGLVELLAAEGLRPEDVRATYAIAMTGASTAMVEAVEGACTLRDVRQGGKPGVPPRGRGLAAPTASIERGALSEFLRQHNAGQELSRALARLAATAAVSAVLSFVAGLGDRHNENFMVTPDGRLLHVDYGYALGKEPLDAMLIHYAVQGGRPATTLQYEELREAIGPDLAGRVFWPVAKGAFLRVRRHAGMLAEMVFAAVIRDAKRVAPQPLTPDAAQRAWATAQDFVARRCATSLGELAAERFICALLWHCARHERGTQFRDELRGLCLRERAQRAVVKACGTAIATGRNATSAVGIAAGAAVDGARPALKRTSLGAGAAARGAAAGLLGGVRDLLQEASVGLPAVSQFSDFRVLENKCS